MALEEGRSTGLGRAVAALVVVAALAGAVRFGYLATYENSPFAETPLGEAAKNVNLGKAMAVRGTLGEEPLSEPPLYQALVSLAVRAGEEGPILRRLQAAIGVLTACLIFLIGRLFLGTAGGLLAGLLFAFYGPAIHWSTRLIPASFLLLVFTCYWISAVRASTRPLLPLWLLAGLFLGAMAATEIGALVLVVPALALVFSKTAPRKGSRKIAALALLVAGTGLAVLPFVLHNARAGAPGAGIAAHGGIEFFVGNNPDATGLPPTLAGENTWWHGARYAASEASIETGRQLGPGEVSRYWFGRGMGFIIRHPLSYLKLVARKLGHFWGRHELTAGPSPSFISKEWAPWSTPLMYGFSVLGSLTLAGLVVLRKKPYALSMAFPLIGALVFALVYTGESSTRLLALPSLAVISSAFIVEYLRAVRARTYGFAIRAGLTLAVAALIVNVVAPALSGVAPSPANDERLLGVVYEVQGKGSIALDQFDRAVKMEPRNQACRLSLASMLASDGVADEAEKQFLVAASLDTLSPTPHLGLANLYRRNGLYEQSLHSLQDAQARAPYDLGLAISLGRSCIEMGLYEQAEMYFRDVLELDPENVSAIDGLLELRDRGVNLRVSDDGEKRPESVSAKIREAMALTRAGEMERAKELLDDAEAAAPDDLDIVFAVATWHLWAGEPEEAIKGYERCLEFNPKNTIVMNNLAAAYQQTGRSEEAKALWRKILSLDPANAKAKANLERLESGGRQEPSESP